VVQAIVTYLQGKGVKVTKVADSHFTIVGDCTVTQAENAFDTTINNYHARNIAEPGRTDYFSFASPLKVPVNVSPYFLSVAGLESFTKPKPMALTCTQTRVLYNTAPLYNGGITGAGRTVAISNWDGYRLSNVPLYYNQFKLPTPAAGVGSNVKVITVDGGSGSGTPSGEGDLDIQMVLGMAPLCNFSIYDGSPTLAGLLDVLTTEANDNSADIISESYGWILGASDNQAAHNLHLQMTLQGITYMNATGDSGTTIEPYSYPDYDPETLHVGGTIATIDNTGNRLNEVAWPGGGGGWSTNTASFNTLPVWQKGNGVPTNINFRLLPDLSLVAAGSNTGAYQFYLNGSLSSDYDGTSFACPVFAGCLAIAQQKVISDGGLPKDSAGKQRMGRIQNLVYGHNGRSDIYFDITSGSNGTLPNGQNSSAKAGWDFTTGWGAVNFQKFAASIAVTPPQVFNVTSIAPFKNTGLSPAVVEGTNPKGSSNNLAAKDSAVYSLTSVNESAVGQVVCMAPIFSTTLNPAKVTSLSFKTCGTTLNTVTVMVYIYNQTTKSYEWLKNLSGTQFATATAIDIPGSSFTNYVSAGGQIQMLVRGLNPNSRSRAPLQFALNLDQFQLTATAKTD
jgi:hypothetical protein